MNNKRKDRIGKKADQKNMARRLCDGVKETLRSPVKGVVTILYVASMIAGWVIRDKLFRYEDLPVLSEMLHDVTLVVAAFAAAVGLIGLLISFGTPFGAERTRENLLRAGLTNDIGEAPVLLSKRKNKDTGLYEWRFNTYGIPRYTWEERQGEIEAALNISIVLIRCEDGKQTVVVEAVPAEGDLPDYIAWDEKYLSAKESVVRIGVGLSGLVEIDFSRQNHWLLAGSTNSGKTILFKLIMMQLKKAGHICAICDLKGGADFGLWWRNNFKMAFEEQEAIEVLESACDELRCRKKLFERMYCPNIECYESVAGKRLPRIIVGCDEAAELFLRGSSKEEKELKTRIEDACSLICRQGRAYGIHLVLATQRGDATILPPQVRSNCDRIVGRCDATNSMIMLDNMDAAKLISKNARGRFIRNDGDGGTLFQAFMYDDKME